MQQKYEKDIRSNIRKEAIIMLEGIFVIALIGAFAYKVEENDKLKKQLSAKKEQEVSHE